MNKQLTLFPAPPRVAEPPFSEWMPFDDWDLSRLVPQPDYVPPEEIRIEGLDGPLPARTAGEG